MGYNRKTLIKITIIIVLISYLFSIFTPTTVGGLMSQYIDTEKIVKITFIIDEVNKDSIPYHISNMESINLLHDYFYDINITRTLATPHLKENDNFTFYLYDEIGNTVRISSHDSYNGLYLYIQSNKWYKVKDYNNSIDLITYMKNMLDI